MCKVTISPKIKNQTFLFLKGVFLFVSLVFGVQQGVSATSRKAETDSFANLISTRSKSIAEYEEYKYQQHKLPGEKLLPTNLFWANAKNYDIKNRSSILEGLTSTKKILNTHYASCDLSNEEISAILFFVNSSFAKELRNQLPRNQLPKKTAYITTCEKLTSCIEGKADKNLNKKCESLINESYLLGLQDKKRSLIVEEANLWKDKYQNGTIEDSAYDLLYDISQIANILFEKPKTFPKEMSALLFYRLPSFKPWTQKNNDPTRGNPTSRTPTTTRGSTSTWGRSTTAEDPSPLLPSSDNIKTWTSSPDRLINQGGLPLSEDPTINAFIKANEPIKTETSAGNVAFVNHCVIAGSKLLEETPENALATSSPTTNAVNLPEKEVDTYIKEVLQNSNTIRTSRDGKIATGAKYPKDSTLATDATLLEEVKKQLEDCVKKCEGLRWDERKICKLQCLCAEYVSPRLPEKTKFHFLEEGALKIRICTIPSKVSIVKTSTKTLYSIEELFDEIQEVVNSLYEGGELTTRKKTKEFLETSLSKFKFHKNISLIVNYGTKAPTTQINEKQAQKAEEEINDRLIDGKQQTEEERNRYLVLADYTATKTERSVPKPETPLPEKQASPISTETLLAQKRIADTNNLISDFIEKNVGLLFLINEDLLSINDYLTALEQKK